MSDKVCVGIDCGDLELRLIYVVDSKLFSLPIPAEVSRPLIFFDQYVKTSSLGVGFPGILQKVGSHIPFKIENHPNHGEQRTETPESVIRQQFAWIQQGLLKVTGKPIGATVMAVPATLGQSGRKALLDCAKAAGFNEITLIDKCTAAALGYHNNSDKSTTALVFDMSYGSCEYSLLRLVKERCRVVASGSVPDASGEMLNSLIMEATVLALRKKRIFLGLKQFTSLQWLTFRRLAEDTRHTLAEQPEALTTLIPELTGLDQPINVRYDVNAFAARIGPLVTKAIDGIHGILEQNTLDIADIDALLLIGESANASPVFEVLSNAFAGKPRRTDPNIIAMGAAWQASQVTEHTVELELSGLNMLIQPEEKTQRHRDKPMLIEPQTGANTEVAEVIDYDYAFTEPSTRAKNLKTDPPGEMSLEAARKLIEQGKRDEATVVLDAIAHEIEALRGKLKEDERLAIPRTLMQQAQAMINTGQFLNAVGFAHEAYAQAPDDPDVFAGMMRIHAEASLGLDRPEEYESAINILKCAHSHDQTDRLIHKALAERHYMHAMAMRNLNNLSNAFAIVDIALSFDPKHAGANQLLKELTPETAPLQSQQNSDES